MRIVYICNEYPPSVAGGIGPAVASMARGMARAGHDVSVVGLYDEEYREWDEGVSVYRLAFPPAVPKLFWLLARIKLYRFLARLHAESCIDIVEWPDYQGWYLSSIAGITDVVRVHGTHMSHWLHGLAPRCRLLEWLELRTLRRIPNWIGVSDWFTEEWLSVSRARPEQRVTIYNPVDMKVFRPSLAQRIPGLILYVGGLKRRKGVDMIARAARLFLSHFPEAKLVLLGMNCDLTKEDVVREAGPVSGRIEFRPFASQHMVAQMMCSASVYLMPSRYESFGNGWAEALACGVPVVGTTSSCGPEIIKDGITGFLADPEDPADVAAKVEKLLSNLELAERMGRAGVEEARERFSLDVAVRKAEEFYLSCCQERIPPASGKLTLVDRKL